MAIKITDGEMWAFNGLNALATNAQAELQRTLQARQAYVELLEAKYNAGFNPTTGELKANEKPTTK